MRATHWLDVSEHNGTPLSDAILRWALWSRWVSFRILDGTYVDRFAARNLSWAAACRALVGFIAYVVFPRSQGTSTAAEVMAAFRALITVHHPRMVVLIDVESWGLHVTGDHSAEITELHVLISAHLFSLRPSWQRSGLLAGWYRRADRARVLDYANAGDRATIMPGRAGMPFVLADYDGPRAVPGEVARQYTSKGHAPGFTGAVDLNVAPCDPVALARRLGLGRLTWTP